MEKLIELLNEYDSSNGWKETDEGIDNIWKIYEFHSELQIISKKYGFIKWLVENEKVDYGKIFNLTKDDNKLSMVADLDEGYFSWEESLLMLLSIQDEPIEFLISILKNV